MPSAYIKTYYYQLCNLWCHSVPQHFVDQKYSGKIPPPRPL